MADQVNGSGEADRKDSPGEAKDVETSKTGAAQSPDNTDAESDKVEVLEEAQRDAAKEREENRGYQ